MRKADEHHERLRRYVLDAGFAEQDRLPPERELAITLGMTRNALRGGLRKLAKEGLIWQHVGKGTYYGQRRLTDLSAISDVTNPLEAMEARLSFEPELARLAAHRSSAHHLADMEACLEKMAATTDWAVWDFLDGRFHRTIAEAAGNALMLVMFDTMQANRNRDVWGELRKVYDGQPRHEAQVEHRDVIAAIRCRNADQAEDSMRRHLERVHRHIFGKGYAS